MSPVLLQQLLLAAVRGRKELIERNNRVWQCQPRLIPAVADKALRNSALKFRTFADGKELWPFNVKQPASDQPQPPVLKLRDDRGPLFPGETMKRVEARAIGV